jgi:hypothetical protein
VTSALRPSGSTRRWRILVAHVFAVKGRACQMIRDGHVCGAYATTVQHVIRREHGGTDAVSNLIPACGPCNYGERDPGDQVATADRLAVALTRRQIEIMFLLDLHGLSCSAGRRQARALLDRWEPELHASGPDLDAACAYRRARGPLTRM